MEHYPNTVAMVKLLANGNPARETQLTDYAKICVEPAFAYFKTKFEEDLKPLVQAFKRARIFSPSKANELKPTTSDVDELKCFSFNLAFIEELKAESFQLIWPSVMVFLLKHRSVTGGEIMNPNYQNGLQLANMYFCANPCLPQLRGFFQS